MAEFILKDWYGNNCTFDKDKIFVQDANGELVEFTQGKGNPTLETLEVTENGTYTPSEGVDGFNSVNVAVPIPEVVLQDKTITENGTFTADEGFDGLRSVTVAVEGSGGGSLPVGGYWGVFEEIPRPNLYNWIFAELGGELYAFSAKNNSETYTGIYYKYKMVDGAWVQLADETFVDADMWMMTFVEFNGKLHFVPKSESKYHWVFDGTTMVKKADMPGYINPRSLFVQDNKLKIICKNSVYAWDEVTDTWVSEATLSVFSTYTTYISAYVVDGVTYMIDGTNVYIYANNTVTKCATTTNTAGSGNNSAVVNGKLYYYYAKQDGVLLYCFDFATKTDRYVTKVPTQLSYGTCYLKSYQGKVLSLQAKPTYASIFQLYEVTE